MTTTPTRECGPCRACCKAVGIYELDSPPGAWCSRVDLESKSGGCSAYDERPASCRAFRCSWLQDSEGSMLLEDERPDKIGGCVISVQQVQPEIHPFEQILTLCEGRPGAAQRPRVVEIIKRLTLGTGGIVVVRLCDSEDELVYYPSGQVQRRTRRLSWDEERQRNLAGDPPAEAAYIPWKIVRREFRDPRRPLAIERVAREQAAEIRRVSKINATRTEKP